MRPGHLLVSFENEEMKEIMVQYPTHQLDDPRMRDYQRIYLRAHGSDRVSGCLKRWHDPKSPFLRMKDPGAPKHGFPSVGKACWLLRQRDHR